MAVEAPPPPTLVLVPAQLPLGLFMELLNSMPAMAILHQFLQWGRGWQVAPIVLVLPLLTPSRPLSQQPALSHSPIPGAPPAIQGYELLPEPALAPLPPPDGAPQAAGQGSQHLVGSAPWGLGRQAYSKVGPDSYHIGFPTLLQSGQGVGIVAVVGIGDHTVVGYSPTPRLVQQGQGNLWFGLEAYLRGYACLAAPPQVLGPGLGQVQAHPHRPEGQGVAVAAGDRHLRVAHLAQGARVLAGHPHRSFPLFGEAGVIQQQHAIAQGSGGQHQLHSLTIEVFLIPGHAAEEPLEALLTGAWHGLSNGVAVLVGQFCEPSGGVAFPGSPGLRAVETHLEAAQEPLKLGQRVRTGTDIHGTPPFCEEDNLWCWN